LVEIGSVVSEEKIFFKFHPPFFLICIIGQNRQKFKEEQNFDEIVIGWFSSKIVSGSRALPPRWLPQCSCIVIESSFDPGEQLQAPLPQYLGCNTVFDMRLCVTFLRRKTVSLQSSIAHRE
jgi:hypothetical protein